MCTIPAIDLYPVVLIIFNQIISCLMFALWVLVQHKVEG